MSEREGPDVEDMVLVWKDIGPKDLRKDLVLPRNNGAHMEIL